ncbi:PREDICTED: uncharacterized protein LOC108568740 [Nicrophorus vespilloides]|uniref:Gustatory receptor n=1 Tax=Nicrophorus vespilloides TaxID=110193 RepID=A0ABM1NFC5_NICVS|nr:PREDICTED: uncharacterized protein LOC108568740 [Nicrophorus vespilloides]
MYNSKMPINRKRSLRAIHLLYNLSSWLCQTPNYDFKRNEVIVSTWDQVRAIIIVSLFIIGYVDFMIMLNYKELSITTLVTYIATMFVSAASQVNVICSAIFWNRDKWKQLLHMFHEVEIFVKHNHDKKSSNRLFYIEVLVAHIYCLAMIIYQCYITYKLIPLQQIIFYNILLYFIFVSSLINYNFAICLKYRYETANGMLIKEISQNSLSMFVITDFKKSYKFQQKNGVLRMWGLFTTLSEIAMRFNDVFGWNMLFISLNIVVQLLYAFDSIVIFSMHKSKTSVDNDDLIAINFLIAILLLVSIDFVKVFGVMVIVSCDVVSANARKTANICYKILLEMHLNDEGREDLALFADQCSSVDNFSAAGFFDINISLLLSLFGVVASNLIIIIQLNQ